MKTRILFRAATAYLLVSLVAIGVVFQLPDGRKDAAIQKPFVIGVDKGEPYTWKVPDGGLVLPFTSIAHAQAPNAQFQQFLGGSPVLYGWGAVSTDVHILVRYTGTSKSGVVAVDAATGDITFTSGASGSETTDTSFECPVSGGLGGVIDVSNAACDTMGEVVDTINGACSTCIKGNWTAVLLGAARADSSNNTLATLSATVANSPEGLGLLHDDTVDFFISLPITPWRTLPPYVADGRSTLKSKPFAGEQPILFHATATTTYGSGTSNHNITCTDFTQARTGGSAVVTTYAQPAGATTVASTLDFPYGISCPTGQKMSYRIVNSAAMTAAVQYAAGRVWRPVP